MKKADIHVHTSFSYDGLSSMDELCRTAEKENADILCFTDHIDFKSHILTYSHIDLNAYFDEYKRMKEKYAGKFKLLIGIEMSEPHQHPEALEMINSMPFDFIIGSMHYWYKGGIPGRSIAGVNYRDVKIPAEEAWTVYWEEEKKMTAYGGIDTVAHLDYPKRHVETVKWTENDLLPIVGNIVDKGLALEINTSPLRKGFDEPLPTREILDFYVSHGGKRITVGSDAHSAAELFKNIEDCCKMVPEGAVAGYFEERKFKAL